MKLGESIRDHIAARRSYVQLLAKRAQKKLRRRRTKLYRGQRWTMFAPLRGVES